MDRQLIELCQKFINDHGITCPETIYQSDRVIEDAYEFIEAICDHVGYQVTDDD